MGVEIYISAPLFFFINERRNKMSIEAVAKAVVAGAKAHKPEIMIGVGLAAGFGAIVVAVKETPACLDAFDKAKEEQKATVKLPATGEEVTVEVDLDWKTKLFIYAKSYWIAAALEVISILFIAGGTKIRLDGYTALVTLYGLTKAERDDLKKIISEQPKNWQKNFAEKMAESHLADSDPNDIPPERMSDTDLPMSLPLFWDDQAKVYFRMSEADLRDALAEFTFKIDTDPFQATSMNDWMSILDHEEVANGDYYLMLSNDPDAADGPLKYNQIGVKEAPNGEPARMMKFSRDYHIDTRGLYTNV